MTNKELETIKVKIEEMSFDLFQIGNHLENEYIKSIGAGIKALTYALDEFNNLIKTH